MCRRAERPPRPGFVLMEAVVALAIIGLFAVALLATTGTQLQTAAKASSLLVARSLAEDRLAALRLLQYDELGDVPDSLRDGRFPPPFQDFTWTAQVAEMEDEYDLFGAEIVVEGRGEVFPLRTLIHTPRPSVLATGAGGVGGQAGGLGGRGGRDGGPGAGRGPGMGRGGQPETGRGGLPGMRGEPPATGRGGQTVRGGQSGRSGGSAGSGS